MFGQYSQTRKGMFLVTIIGSGLIWSGVGQPILALAQEPDPATQLYVSYIRASWYHATGGMKQFRAYVDIVDGYGNHVNGALVVGNWSGCFKLNGVSDTTETVCTTVDGVTTCVDGRALVPGKKISCAKNCTSTFTITNVAKNGMMYVPVAGKTSGSISCATW